MRLKHIKLVGFKSFVDPTTVKLPSNLVGIVGPNGCGKSNIIDAVRWVMGEGSAKNLRGESMADVIFNGSTARQPVGQASIELCFDNHDGSLGGEYAKYSEIVIKRLVGRDGLSSYYLNGVRCRRRDILDVFMGTGLGPRSYAIIEQGTISRVIEARPEEMRIHLEEVAGISKYKERRRETEMRMRHTRENLERLTDIREELDKQLAHLQRQASSAEKFKLYKEEQRLYTAQYQTLEWQHLENSITTQERTIKEQENALEAEIANIRSLDAKNETERDLLLTKTDEFNEIQAQYYRLGAEIARLEQTIKTHQERDEQLTRDLQENQQQVSEITLQLQHDEHDVQTYSQQLDTITPELTSAQTALDQALEALSFAEEHRQEWQDQWDEFNTQAAQQTQQAEVEQTRIHHLEEQLQQANKRSQQLQNEINAIHCQQVENEITAAAQTLAQQQEKYQCAEETVNEIQDSLQHARELQQHLSQQLDQERRELHQLQGEETSLQALQQAALGAKDTIRNQWLEQHGLAQQPRLAQLIKVENGWEKAVETILEEHLQAICVDELQLQESQLAACGILLWEKNAGEAQASNVNQDSLLAKITADFVLPHALKQIYLSDTFSEAWQRRSQLTLEESIITRDGIWVGKHWLRMPKAQGEMGGVLIREQELKQLAEKITALQTQIDTTENNIRHQRHQVEQFEAQREAAQRELTALKLAMGETLNHQRNLERQLNQYQQRLQKLKEDHNEIRAKYQDDELMLNQARQRWEQALSAIEHDSERREQLLQQRDNTKAKLDQAREIVQDYRDRQHELAMKHQQLQTQISSLKQSCERLQKQLITHQQRHTHLQDQLQHNNQPRESFTQELQDYLTQRVSVEQALHQARDSVETLEQSLRSISKDRHLFEEKTQTLRNDLEKYRMSWQTMVVQRDSFRGQIDQSGYSLETLIQEMPAEADRQQWQEHIEQLERRIQRLGPINLAAIEECELQTERKRYLDAQNADLVSALETLENAIRKIDRETRHLLRDTFETVNRNFQTLFPKVFGGGSATLELTGEDLLDAGITVMARPPGKRNSTIHLLSGGEKALTAVALVFAMFQLNPAPFCLLDEVDAPLDDVNVGRFCQLVKEMSQQVQFLVITHNKVTMEMADQLTGVTMSEPGVSRIVAVDLQEAVSLANA
ncbi:MAG: chromosome segregation protein SMC [Legionellales bacterium]|nr:chromosome segregation protein SMC [Legionellales bacterium]